MPQTLLICGNGMSGNVIKYIKEWGYNVALISEFPDVVGVSDVDHFVEANTKNIFDSVQAADKLASMGVKFDGVISLCWDCAESVAHIAEKYHLFGVSADSARLASRKDLRSAAFEKAHVPAPKYDIVTSLAMLMERSALFEYPIIIKPVDLSSSKGVILVDGPEQLEYAFHYARGFSTSPEIVINEYLEGSEHSTEGLMIGGQFHLSAISDRVFKYSDFKPYFVEVGDLMPTSLQPHSIELLNEVTERAALALGITDGIVKGDLIYCPRKGASVFEIAARLGGPRFGTEMVPLSNGTNILKAAIQQALGEAIDKSLLQAKFSRGLVNRSLFPPPGLIKSIEGLNAIKTMPGYYDFSWWTRQLKVGDIIPPYENTCGNVGYLIVTGEDRAEAEKNADAIERRIKINTATTV